MAVIPPSCMAIIAGPQPYSSLKIPVYQPTLEASAAAASGLRRALDAQGKRDTQVVVLAGDGGTYDIGFQCLSSAAERNEDFLYVCLDNEGYMNTGAQKSSSTPHYASTGSTPAGKTSRKKNLLEIMAAHGCRTWPPPAPPPARPAAQGEGQGNARRLGAGRRRRWRGTRLSARRGRGRRALGQAQGRPDAAVHRHLRRARHAIDNGFKLYVAAEQGGKLGGREIEYFKRRRRVRPGQGHRQRQQADQARQGRRHRRHRALRRGDGDGRAAKHSNTLLIVPNAGADAVTGALCAPNIFRSSFSNWQPATRWAR
jgi:hypothetical protein